MTQARIAGLAVLVCLLTVGTSGTLHAKDPWAGTPQKDFLEGPIIKKFQCVTCHTITDIGGTVGPVLNQVGLRRDEEWLRRWLTNPNLVKPGTKMPKFPFTPEEFDLAVKSLMSLKRELHSDEILAGNGTLVEKGEALFKDYDCQACHRIGEEGRFVGPDLTWVGTRKQEEWERLWLADPAAFKPDTFMPNLHIPEEGVQALAAYLHELQGQANDKSRESEFMVNILINNNDVRRGELVFRRLACWSCHGEGGEGGVRNPNTAPDQETIVDLKETRDAYDLEAFLAKVSEGSTVAAANPDALLQPFNCPPFQGALNKLEGEDLYAYVSSLAPPKLRWKVE